MMNKLLKSIILLSLCICLICCKEGMSFAKNNDEIQQVATITNSSNYEIKNIHIAKEKDKIVIDYPKVEGMTDVLLQKKLNEKIQKYAMQEVIYCNDDVEISEDDFRDKLKQNEKIFDVSSLEVSYQVMLRTNQILSILFFTDVEQSRRRAYSINLDLNTGKEMKLENIVTVDKPFLHKYLSFKPDREEKNWESYFKESEGILRMLEVEYTESELIESLQHADWKDTYIYSYYTKNGIGISYPVGRYVGGYVLAEIKYNDLRNNIKEDSVIWNELHGLRGRNTFLINNILNGGIALVLIGVVIFLIAIIAKNRKRLIQVCRITILGRSKSDRKIQCLGCVALCIGIMVGVGIKRISPMIMKPTISNEVEMEAEVTKHDEQKLNTDRGYKMLYGEWVLTKAVGYNYRTDESDVSDVIGKHFSFSAWESYFVYRNEEVHITYPKYIITTIPIDESTTYFYYMPSLKEMGLKGTYATIFCVSGNGCGYNLYFIIKDDDTMLMFYNDCYIEMKRVKHIPNYELYYQPM